MPILRPAAPRPAPTAAAVPIVLLVLVAAACSIGEPTATTAPTPAASPTPLLTPGPTPSPTATPEPTPRYTNEPDTELAGLIPPEVNGVPVVVAPFDEFALTPGDVGGAYGEIGDRFASLVVAYVGEPRTTLYAMRVDGDSVATADLEPYLATAGRYVGIAGLDPEPWTLADVGGTAAWVRPEDNATAAGTMIYTWSSGEYVFLLIGVEDAVNRALIAGLPGEPTPTPTPVPTTPPASGPPSGAPPGSGEPSAEPTDGG